MQVRAAMSSSTSVTYLRSSARADDTGTFQRESSACRVATAKPSRAARASKPDSLARAVALPPLGCRSMTSGTRAWPAALAGTKSR